MLTFDRYRAWLHTQPAARAWYGPEVLWRAPGAQEWRTWPAWGLAVLGRTLCLPQPVRRDTVLAVLEEVEQHMGHMRRREGA